MMDLLYRLLRLASRASLWGNHCTCLSCMDVRARLRHSVFNYSFISILAVWALPLEWFWEVLCFWPVWNGRKTRALIAALQLAMGRAAEYKFRLKKKRPLGARACGKANEYGGAWSCDVIS